MSKLFGLLKRRNVAFAMVGVMLTFAGAFAMFTYLRPFRETRTHVTLAELSLLLLSLGSAGFVGTLSCERARASPSLSHARIAASIVDCCDRLGC